MISSKSVFYHIYPLGALDALKGDASPQDASRRLNSLKTWIPHIQSLGCNAVYLGPVFKSVLHGYDTIDYRTVDPRLGTNGDLRDLVCAFHSAGIDIVLDTVFNHSGREFFAFKDIADKKAASEYASWYSGLDFSVQGAMNDGFKYEGWAGCNDLVKFNLQCEGTRNYLFDTAEFWIREFDIDGFRLDAADVMDRAFLKDLGSRCRNLKPGFWLMGEMVHGDYRELLGQAGLDSVTNYESYKGLWSSCNDVNMHEIAYSLKRQFGAGGMYEGSRLYSFLDNHDVNRIVSTLSNPEKVFPLYCLLFLMPGIPSVYYASEWMERGTRTVTDRDLRKPFSPGIGPASSDAQELAKVIQRLSALRKAQPELGDGGYEEVSVSADTVCFKRADTRSESVVAVNIGKNDRNVATGYAQGTRLYDSLNGQDVTVLNGGMVTVSANWARVLVA